MTTTPTFFRSEQQANIVETGQQFNQQTVGLKDGSFVVLWDSDADTGAGSANSTDIIGRHYDAEGNALGGEFQVNKSFFLDREGNFSAKALPNGNFVVVYEDTNASGTSIRFDILSPSGQGIDSGTILSDPGADSIGSPSVAVAPNGDFLVAYDRGNGATEVVRVDAAGNVGSPSTAVFHGDTFVNTAVTALENGTFVAITEDKSGLGDAGIAFRLISPVGNPIGSATSVGNTFSNGQSDFRPSVTALTGGGFVVSWTNLDQDDDIQFQRYDASGNELGGVVTVNSVGAADNNDDTSLVALSDGGFALAYTDDIDQTIKVQRFSASGAEVGSVVTVEKDGFSNDPHITLSADGRLLVTWGVLDNAFADQNVEFAILDPRESVIFGSSASEAITSRKDGATVNGLGGDDELLGQGGQDTLNGGTGRDDLFGRAGKDTLDGGSNRDLLDGGTGADTMKGGSDDDRYVVDNAGDTVIEFAGQGTDRVQSSVSHQLAANLENLTLTGSANINATGNALANDLFGNTGANVLNGLGGADEMRGGRGNDTYFVDNVGDTVFEFGGNQGTDNVRSSVSFALGANVENLLLTGSGNVNGTGNGLANVLTGNGGANVLDGGLGIDRMTGGAGNDTFLFKTALGSSNVDRITDFSAVADTIKLENAIFKGLAAGALSASAFKDIGVAGATVDANDRVIYNRGTGALSFDADGSGAGQAVKFATLDNHAALTFHDFFIV